MFFDKIIYGTQYYRTPTPLMQEWEVDIPNMESYNIDAFQIRMNWRWNERVEDCYDFSDVDRLIELAEILILYAYTGIGNFESYVSNTVHYPLVPDP